MPKRKLTPRQERFRDEYLIDLDQKAAAIRAGYSAKSAESAASHLIKHPQVRAAILEAKRVRSEKTGIDAEWVLQKLRDILESDIADILHPQTKAVLPVDEWPLIWRQMCDEIHVKELFERSTDGKDSSWDKVGEIIRTKFASKLKALEDIGNHVAVKAFPQKESTVNLNVNVSDLTERLHAGRRRVQSDEDRVH